MFEGRPGIWRSRGQGHFRKRRMSHQVLAVHGNVLKRPCRNRAAGINKFYILRADAGKILHQMCVDQGLTVFVSPGSIRTQGLREKSFEDNAPGSAAALESSNKHRRARGDMRRLLRRGTLLAVTLGIGEQAR